MKDVGQTLYELLRKNVFDSYEARIPMPPWEQVKEKDREIYRKTASEFLSKAAQAV